MSRTAQFGPRRLAIWLAALALAVRLAVPVGFMPASDGRLALVACPEAGPVVHAMAMPMAMGMPMPGMAHGHDDAPPHDQRCPFGALAAAADLVGAPPLALALVVLAPLAPAPTPLAAQPGLGLAAPPPPKTGPPPLR